MSVTTDNSPQRKPDALRDIYLDAVANDRGPSAQSTEAVLAHARQQAAVAASQPAALPAAQVQAQDKLKPAPAANDRYWLRHALGGLAAVGLVGWLMLQHAAWWDGSDKGIGAEPAGQVVAETPEAVPADASSAASTAVAEAVAADAAPADEPMAAAAPVANAPRPSARASASMAEKSTPDRPAVKAEITPDAMKEEATVSASPSANRPVRNAPAASKMQSHSASSSAEAMDQAAEKTQEKAQEKTKDLSQLPLCPEEPVSAEAKAAAKPARKSEEAAPTCRPRKPHEKRQVPAVSGSGAADPVANPDN